MSNRTNSEDNGQLHLESTLEMIYEMPNFNRWIYDLIEPYLGPRVVEVGCGVGSFTHLLSEQQREVVATDIEPAYIERVRQSFNGSPRVQAFQYDIGAKLPPELAEFGADAVVCMNVLEHIEDDRHAMGNIANMLAPGGKSIVLVPAFPWLYGSMDKHYRHYRRYRKEELEQLARDSSLEMLDIFNRSHETSIY
jgi:2-polyprenyl-3-methyl-5-hydroxy-6-metoxy-1,4-benzoquinol methylase